MGDQTDHDSGRFWRIFQIFVNRINFFQLGSIDMQIHKKTEHGRCQKEETNHLEKRWQEIEEEIDRHQQE